MHASREPEDCAAAGGASPPCNFLSHPSDFDNCPQQITFTNTSTHHLHSFISQHLPRLQSASHSEPETPNRHYWPLKNASRNQQSASISSNLASPPISISITTKPAHHHFRLRLAPNPTRFLEPREREKETRQLPFLHSSQPMTQPSTTNVSFSHALISRPLSSASAVLQPLNLPPSCLTLSNYTFFSRRYWNLSGTRATARGPTIGRPGGPPFDSTVPSLIPRHM